MLNERYFNAMLGFKTQVKLYYDRGIAANQYTTDDYYYDDGEILFNETSFDALDFVGVLIAIAPMMIIPLIIIFIIMCASYKKVLSGYRMKHVVSAQPYIMPDSIVLSVQQDSFVREYTTRTRISSSSSGGRSGGRSSSHRSSGGGRHGGGGRHR